MYIFTSIQSHQLPHHKENYCMATLGEATPRRTFLGTLAAGATAVLGIAGIASTASRLIAKPNSQPKGSDNTEFEGWLNKINGKHRQVYDATAENGGMPFAWARIFLMTSGMPETDISTVVILRHEAIPLAFDHSLWEKYKLGEFFKITDKATKAPSVRNPYYHPKPGELMLDSFAMDELMKSGVMFGACNMAIKVYSGMLAKKMNVDADVVMKEWLAGVLPGIQVVPSGVVAVNRTQEHGCTYCYAGG
jgi:intracellular sulfur oxidation DsrE/DsrF family protein